MLPGPETLPIRIRRQRLQQVATELELHRLVEDLLKALKYRWVAVTHGVGEQGKDLVAFSETRTGGEEYLAVVVKRGSISGGVDGKQNLRQVETQIELAFNVPYEGEEVKGSRNITRVLVVCNGSISENAQTQIRARSRELRNVEFWDLDRLEQLTTQYTPGFYLDMSATEREYLENLRAKCVDLTEEHKRLGAKKARLLTDVFVEPTIVFASDLGEDRRSLQGRPRKSKIAPEWLQPPTFDTSTIAEPAKSVILLGDPGSGKSMVLRRAAIRLVERRLAGDHDAPMPLMASASQILQHLSQGQVRALLSSMPVVHRGLAAEEVARQLLDRPATLFVDGIDEIPRPEDRGTVVRFLRELDSTFPNLRVICAMRLNRLWKPDSMQNYQQAVVLPLNNRTMAQLVERLLGRGRKMHSVLRALAESGISRGLPHTPLVVTLLAILHEQEERDELPATITDLYDMFIQVYLGRWSEGNAGQRGPLAYSERIAVLRRLAVQLHTTGRVETTQSEMASVAEEYLRVRGRAGRGKALAEDLACNSGLFVARGCRGGEMVFEFVHLSFQEFLVAAHVADTRDGVDELLRRFPDPWWSSVVCFYSGFRKDAPEVVRAIINQGVPNNQFASLAVALQLGHVLQAAVDTPDPVKTEGCLHGSNLMQVFYTVYAQEQKAGRVPFRLTQLQLLLSLGLWYAMAYGSNYMRSAQVEAMQAALLQFERCEDSGQRLLWGLRAFCAASALASRGDPIGLSMFVETCHRGDLPLLQAAAGTIQLLLESRGASAADEEKWVGIERHLRAFARKVGPEAVVRSLDRPLRPLGDSPRLLDSTPEGTE